AGFQALQTAAEQLAEGAFGQAGRDLHQRFFNCLALANSEAMALLLGAGAALSLRGALPWEERGAEPGREPRAPSIFSPG
ncbi:hypothetical protein, partial [Pseudoalteromonas sp. SIMBA_162]|uniref:hypothetical protein n=1 Tax=Pseudoalteromonas sp. SIMBA_162 TaxID=3080867 RepID=UPI0039796071